MGRESWSMGYLVGRVLLPLAVVATLFIFGVRLFDLYRQVDVNGSIDAHTQQVTATATAGLVGTGLFKVESRQVQFEFQGRQITTGAYGLPDDIDGLASVCLEIDSERPYRARVCGTRSIGQAQRNLIVPGALVVASVGLWGFYLWSRRSRRSVSPAGIS
jgi:hypothetical protein